MNESIMQQLSEQSEQYAEIMKKTEDDQEEFWNSLSKEDQLKVFCAISRRICKGELEVRGTYRYVLYNIFRFGPGAYAPAQHAGYLAIHNAIHDEGYDGRLLREFCKKYNIEDAEQKVLDFFLWKKLYLII